MKLKKVLSVLMVSAMFLTGCASGNSGKQEEKKAEEEKSVKVVACSVAATNVLHELGYNRNPNNSIRYTRRSKRFTTSRTSNGTRFRKSCLT